MEREQHASLVQTGKHYIELNKYREAKSYFEQALVGGKTEELYWYLALCCLNLNKLDEAQEFCRQAIEDGYQKDIFYRVIGIVYYRQGAYYHSEQAFLEGLRLNPTSAVTMANYAHLMLITGHNDKARQLLTEALELQPQNSVVLHFLTEYEGVNGSIKRREEATIAYLETGATELHKLAKLSNLAIQKKKYREAQGYLQQMLAMDPAHVAALKTLQDVQRKLHPLFWIERSFTSVFGYSIWIAVMFLSSYVLTKMGYPGPLVFLIPVVLVLYNKFIANPVYNWIQRRK